ncbi:MAG TPA: DinB family protein [Cytophagaceae bacterium]|jgi:uncharacterized damage-inducible protein DinB
MTLTETTSLSVIPMLLKELEEEANTTRKMLRMVPTEKFDWQPHPKSMNIKTLSTHIAELPAWVGMTLETTGLDFAITPYVPVDIKNTEELLNFFEHSLQEGKSKLEKATEEQLLEIWTLRNGETIYSSSPRIESIRQTYCQIVHHRAQLGVFLRLLDIPIPGSYGPSADDMNF